MKILNSVNALYLSEALSTVTYGIGTEESSLTFFVHALATNMTPTIIWNEQDTHPYEELRHSKKDVEAVPLIK